MTEVPENNDTVLQVTIIWNIKSYKYKLWLNPLDYVNLDIYLPLIIQDI